jgi:uncharacterized protein (TIGR03067 family)
MRLPTTLLRSRRLKTAAAVVFALLVLLSVFAWPPSGDAARIQGHWAVVAVEDSGVPTNEPFLKTRQYIFDGRKMMVRGRGDVGLSWLEDWIGRNLKSPSFRLDTDATPKEIDLFLPDFSTMRGIYEWEDDRLKICFSRPWGESARMRPTGFSVPGSSARLLVLQRDKK